MLWGEERLIPTPLEKIDQAVSDGKLRQSQAIRQKSYYLLSDPRYEVKKFGTTPTSPSGRYDCSATAVFRSMFLERETDRHADPYGLLWKPWIEEAYRIAHSGDERIIGKIGKIDIRLVMPKGKVHPKGPSYRALARVLSRFLEGDGAKLRKWRHRRFGRVKIKPWNADLIWPPSFLAGRSPYLASYFDAHPYYDAGQESKWKRYLNKFLKALNFNSKSEIQKKGDTSSWTWVISDRVLRNTLIWGPHGKNLLFLSPRCLDRAVGHDWRQKKLWQGYWKEAVLHELLLAYYLNAKPKDFYQDPWMDAVMQASVQPFLDKPGIFYANGPFFTMTGLVSLQEEMRTDYLRYGSAPLWRFLIRAEGPKSIKSHFKHVQRSGRDIRKYLSRESNGYEHWFSYATWALSLKGTPEQLRDDIALWVNPSNVRHPQDILLKPIDPPKGTIGSANSPILPFSIRYFHIPIEDSRKIAALKVLWEPVDTFLKGYLFLAKGRHREQARFLDYTVVKPGLSQEVVFAAESLPTEAYFVVINSSDNSVAANELRLQITVLPK